MSKFPFTVAVVNKTEGLGISYIRNIYMKATGESEENASNQKFMNSFI